MYWRVWCYHVFQLTLQYPFSVSSLFLCRWMPHSIHHSVSFPKNSSSLPGAINKHFAHRCDSNLNATSTDGNSGRQCIPTCSLLRTILWYPKSNAALDLPGRKLLNADVRQVVVLFECLWGNFLSPICGPVGGGGFLNENVCYRLYLTPLKRLWNRLQ
jgi:hypothetical protein